MKTEYSFEKRAGHLYMTISGEFEIHNFLSYPKIIRDECDKEKIYKILVNALNIPGLDISTMDRFIIGEEAAKYLSYKVKLAFVWHKEHINHFAETVALNRGANIRVLSDITEAEKLLLGNDLDK